MEKDEIELMNSFSYKKLETEALKLFKFCNVKDKNGLCALEGIDEELCDICEEDGWCADACPMYRLQRGTIPKLVMFQVWKFLSVKAQGLGYA